MLKVTLISKVMEGEFKHRRPGSPKEPYYLRKKIHHNVVSNDTLQTFVFIYLSFVCMMCVHVPKY